MDLITQQHKAIRTTSRTEKEMWQHDFSVATHFFLAVIYANEKASSFINEFLGLLKKDDKVYRTEVKKIAKEIDKRLSSYENDINRQIGKDNEWYRADINQAMDDISKNITDRLFNTVKAYGKSKGVTKEKLYALNEMAMVTADIARLTFEIFERKQKAFCTFYCRKYSTPFKFNPNFEGIFKLIVKLSDILYKRYGWKELDPSKNPECAQLLGEYQHSMFSQENFNYAVKYANLQKKKND